jgi:hypothetical protein
MSTDIQPIINAMATVLRPALPGVTVYTNRPGVINAPAIVFTVEGIDYDSTFDDESDEVRIDVNIFTSLGSDGSGESTLWTYIKSTGSTSVKAILEADDTLGDVVEYLQVRRARAPGIAKFGAGEYYGVAVECYVGMSNV